MLRLAFCIAFTVVTFVATAQKDGSHFVKIEGGEYSVGVKGHSINPQRTVQLETYYISAYEVTNAEFEKFVAATAYITSAEKANNALTFNIELKLGEFEWQTDSTAYWRFPNGVKLGGIGDKANHPVTCISYSDALAYCEWAGVRLPTIDEWEVASKAESKTQYFWGKYSFLIYAYANVWRGEDHRAYGSGESFKYTSPVGSFAPNSFGLYDVYGNVFEFCADKPVYYQDKKGVVCSRGGSWWCSRNSCNYFNSIDIGKVRKHASFSNQGFRVVKNND